MTINKLDLLNDSARYQLDILRIFNKRKGQFISVEFLVELLGISKFRVNKYITELEQVLEKVTSARIIRLPKGEIDIHHLTNEVIRKIQLYYLKQSDLFLFFHEMIQFESTPEKFSQKYFLSRSKAYMVKNKLEDILSEADIHINDGKLVGDEIKIRREIFDIYYYFFNGLESPFDITLRQKVHEVMKVIIYTFNLETIMTRLAKLELFLSITILRIMKKNYVEAVEIEFDSIHSEEVQQKLVLIQNKLQKSGTIPEEKQEYEQLWLMIFLLSEECISLTDYAKKIKSCPDLTDVTNKQVDYLFKTLRLSFTEAEQQQRRLQLSQMLSLTNFKLAFANYSRLTFITQEQECILGELYPQIHQVAKKFIEIVKKKYYSQQTIIYTNKHLL
ncbi:helix-turn-helix domain-containing protein [Enterococcus faecalis]|uniref:helix-turn-helix domain-containing protein n=1 Tax=Enterococcus faecalis TaxID=1351 RepID=UPI0025B14141|nr:helix-turn-helix domain-containing protein [Enterococcus faecalis]MDN3201485.1 helix-turn-helix domain-containing protein [Enterococcus faecalis]